MYSIIASVVVSGALVLTGMWAHMGAFQDLYAKVMYEHDPLVTRLADEPRFGLSTFLPFQGGTGISDTPSYGQMLVGNSSGTYTLTATSSLGISAGSSGNSFSYLFPSNATTTLLSFLGGASTTDFSATTLAVGGSATTSIDASGNLTVVGDVTAFGTM